MDDQVNDRNQNGEQNVTGNYPSHDESKHITETHGPVIHVKPLKEDSNELEKLVCLDNKGLQSRNENPSSGLTSNNGRGVVLLKTHLVSELVYPTDISLKESPAVFETNKQDTDSSSNQVKKDVFLSYNHSQQELCLQIQQALEKEGFNVWIDEKCVQGDLLQCIAEGMENAPVFLMLISKQYYESFYCQAEAEYAFELRKKIIPIVMQKDYIALYTNYV
jgi:hypothetical protein